MRRTLSVWFPTFSTDRVKRRLQSPLSALASPAFTILLTRAASGRERIARRCEMAQAAGISEGMDLAHARSLLPAGSVVHVEPYRPDVDASALHAAACRAIRFSPLVACDAPDGLLIDITGMERLYRNESRLIRAVARYMGRRGFRVRIAAASTFACAWATARYGRYALARVSAKKEREALLPLPVAALRIDPASVQALCEIGMSRIEHVVDLPRASLAARFGPELSGRLDQALGRAGESIEPVRPVPPPRAERVLDGPTDQWASVEAAVRHVLEALIAQLTTSGRGVRLLRLELARPYAKPACDEIMLSRPSRNAKHLWTLVRTRLERMDIGQGVETVTLTAVRTGRLRHRQAGIAALGVATHEHIAAWGELIDTLTGRLGPENVVRMEAVESHLPERAFRERPVLKFAKQTSVQLRGDRPSILLPKPEPAQAIALSPDGPVISLAWRGERWRIITSIGPERIGAEWWRWDAGLAVNARTRTARPPPDRDYFAVQTETGRWLWACRQVGTGKWFVHGEWS